MEKRAFKRTSVKCEGNFIFDNISCVAYIRNVSALGVNAIITPMHCSPDFVKETKQELKLNTPSGATITLNCTRKWSSAIAPQGLTKEIGLEIIDPPIQYNELLNTL
jgi:hypothetical protein